MSEASDLVLYHYTSCPFCLRVRYAAKRLGLDLKLADIHKTPEHRQELVDAMGRSTVPVLKIEKDGEVHWMPESADIVKYLKERFA